ncbi:hypothetical protein BDF14DRAFT_1804693 [Spinellus fusiger]|nr:hypothetical protein BDF14DRAFT_1804693 [Spinellus fusiger]
MITSTIQSPLKDSRENSHSTLLSVQLLNPSSIQNGLQLASQVNVTHVEDECIGCSKVAWYYRKTLQYICQSEPIHCQADTLELVWKICCLVLAHCESGRAGYHRWVDAMVQELWYFGKRLKDEVYAPQLMLPIQHNYKSFPNTTITDQQSDYRQAIRVAIYYCRGELYHQSNNIPQATLYYRKCIAIPTTFEEQQWLQISASKALQTMGARESPSYSANVSCSSSLSSGSSTSSSCSNCGVEKRTMPICAKCKKQVYCSARCLIAHKATHEPYCHPIKR